MRLPNIGIDYGNGPALRYPGSQGQCEGGLARIGASENQARTSFEKAPPLKILCYSVGPILRHQSSHLANGSICRILAELGDISAATNISLEIQNPKPTGWVAPQIQNSNAQTFKMARLGHLDFGHLRLFSISSFVLRICPFRVFCS
jgi:hypothetical protein